MSLCGFHGTGSLRFALCTAEDSSIRTEVEPSCQTGKSLYLYDSKVLGLLKDVSPSSWVCRGFAGPWDSASQKSLLSRLRYMTASH